MQINDTILNINNGPFLSTKAPKIINEIIIEKAWNTIKNCNAFPFIPIKAPKVLPVFPINEIEKLISNEIKDILYSLKFFIAFLILYFDEFSFTSFSLGETSLDELFSIFFSSSLFSIIRLVVFSFSEFGFSSWFTLYSCINKKDKI